MSIQFSQEKLRGEKRREVIKAIQKRVQTAVLIAVAEVIEACLEEEITAKLGREKGEPRRVSGQVREIDWRCGNCGCKDANQFTRDGHYHRNLETGWGHIRNIRVPMLECQCCGHDVICDYAILEKYRRFWSGRGIRTYYGVPPVVKVSAILSSGGALLLGAMSDCARLTSVSTK
jgi:hypothetical protein